MPLFTGSRLGFGKAVVAVAEAAAEEGYRVAKSLRFNPDDTANLSKTFSSAGNRKTWTWSGWVKRSSLDTYNYLFTARSASTNYYVLSFTNDWIEWYARPTTGTHRYAKTTALFRDPSAWYHVVLAWDTTEGTDSDRAKLYVNGERITDYTMSSWPSSFEEGIINDNHHHEIGAYDSGSQYQFDGLISDVNFVDGLALDHTSFGETDATTGQWVPKEYTHSTSDWHTVNNGTTWSDETSGGAVHGSYPMTQSFNGSTANTGARAVSGGGFIFGGSLGISYSSSIRVHSGVSGVGTQQFKLNDGTATNMAENTWVTVASGSGTLNKLEITAGSTGNSNMYLGAVEVDGTVLIDGQNDAAGIDVLSDSPSTYDDGGNGVGNYCTLNPLDSSSGETFSDGNLKVVTATGNWGQHSSTMGMSSGKWYCEVTFDAISSGSFYGNCGIIDVDQLGVAAASTGGGTPGHGASRSYGYGGWDGKLYNNSSPIGSTASTYAVGDTIGIAFDAGSGDLTFYKNGVAQNHGSFTNPPTGYTYVFIGGEYDSGHTGTQTWNFGQRQFAYTNAGVDRPAADFLALNTFNLPDPLIDDPSEHFDIATDTGANILTTATVLTDGADFVWIKDRANSDDHILFNRINDTGMDGTPHMRSNEKDFESTCGTYSAPSGNSVGWVWNAGSSTVSNTDGSITSSVRANPTAGFSIVSYTGSGSNATIGHGLNDAPGLIIIKNRDELKNWVVGHSALSTGNSLRLNLDDSVSTAGTIFNSTDPTSSVFSVGTNISINGSADKIIAYCWSEVEGYSKFSSFEADGVADGPYVHLGFRPAIILLKNADDGTNRHWCIVDGTRSSFNKSASAEVLFPDDSQVESYADNNYGQFGSKPCVDILSNGFKVREADTIGPYTQTNRSDTIIYAAWAHQPMNNLYGAQSNAR